jgi:hypothetical protein
MTLVERQLRSELRRAERSRNFHLAAYHCHQLCDHLGLDDQSHQEMLTRALASRSSSGFVARQARQAYSDARDYATARALLQVAVEIQSHEGE